MGHRRKIFHFTLFIYFFRKYKFPPLRFLLSITLSPQHSPPSPRSSNSKSRNPYSPFTIFLPPFWNSYPLYFLWSSSKKKRSKINVLTPRGKYTFFFKSFIREVMFQTESNLSQLPLANWDGGEGEGKPNSVDFDFRILIHKSLVRLLS